ncbi:MAG: hypothetical protein ABFS39_16090 [Pseudomonadota bacterium]
MNQATAAKFQAYTADRLNQIPQLANIPDELRRETDAVKAAITRIRKTGATIWTQSPLLAGINDDPEIWSALWRKQPRLGCLPHPPVSTGRAL